MRIRVDLNGGLPATMSCIPWLGISVLIGMALAGCGGREPRQLIALDVQPSNAAAVTPRGTTPFSATGTFDQAPTTQTNLTVQWASSDSSIATVAANGIATCVAIGAPVRVIASAAGKGGTVHDSGMLTCVAPPRSGPGHCVVPSGETAMNGFCVGELGGLCREAYDPTNCPPGQAAISPGAEQCNPSTFTVDTSSSCIP